MPSPTNTCGNTSQTFREAEQPQQKYLQMAERRSAAPYSGKTLNRAEQAEDNAMTKGWGGEADVQCDRKPGQQL